MACWCLFSWSEVLYWLTGTFPTCLLPLPHYTLSTSFRLTFLLALSFPQPTTFFWLCCRLMHFLKSLNSSLSSCHWFSLVIFLALSW